MLVRVCEQRTLKVCTLNMLLWPCVAWFTVTPQLWQQTFRELSLIRAGLSQYPFAGAPALPLANSLHAQCIYVFWPSLIRILRPCRQQRAVLALQAAWRGHMARRRYSAFRSAVVTLQSRWRGKCARRELRRRRAEVRYTSILHRSRHFAWQALVWQDSSGSSFLPPKSCSMIRCRVCRALYEDQRS